MGRWVEVAKVDDLPLGEGKTVNAAGLVLAVFNDDGEFIAIDDTCPHQGASLGEGTLHQGRVICPWHSWMFDLRTGECPGVPETTVRRYSTRRSGDAIEVEIPE